MQREEWRRFVGGGGGIEKESLERGALAVGWGTRNRTSIDRSRICRPAFRRSPNNENHGQRGAPREIRTPDPLIRSQVLYPTELWAHGVITNNLDRKPSLAGWIPPPHSGRRVRQTQARIQDRCGGIALRSVSTVALAQSTARAVYRPSRTSRVERIYSSPTPQ